jgi:hypothetical protein
MNVEMHVRGTEHKFRKLVQKMCPYCNESDMFLQRFICNKHSFRRGNQAFMSCINNIQEINDTLK